MEVAGASGVLAFNLGPIAASDKITVAGTFTIGDDALGFSDFDFTNGGGPQPGTCKLITSGDYGDWAGQFAPADLGDPNAGFDGDGLTNNQERIFGLTG